MHNPFIYGEVVTGSDFADRKDEIEDLVKLVQEGDHEAFAELYDIFIDYI